MVQQLGTRNNGLYTNEWIIGDAKNNEIAMYELGTNHTKLWRSSKNEWFNDTPGFYWGDNNAKDLAVNLEYQPDPHAAPEYIPFVPAVRDLAWMELYNKNKGAIDEQFAFQAFDRAPLVSASTMDAKVITADMANRMMTWGAFGRPNESVAAPKDSNYGLFPGGYHLFQVQSSAALSAEVSSRERTRLDSGTAKPKPQEHKLISWHDRSDELWKGWILPASDADTWFVAGSAAYYELLQSRDVEKAIETREDPAARPEATVRDAPQLVPHAAD